MSDETKEKMSEAKEGQKRSIETKAKISKTLQGNKHSAETKLKMSLSKMKYDPDNPYCDVWKDGEYKKDIRKDYCENTDCNKDYKQLGNHHIYLDKKRCAPSDIITLCHSCHMLLHRKLQCGTRISADPQDYIIIDRPDHVSYIHKRSRTVIKIRKRL